SYSFEIPKLNIQATPKAGSKSQKTVSYTPEIPETEMSTRHTPKNGIESSNYATNI
ncbi:5924_t:CDS:1, partial [Dentiscutata heterogama]